MMKEAEESLSEREQPKRKGETPGHKGRKPKRRKLDLLEGWGVRTSQAEEEVTQMNTNV